MVSGAGGWGDSDPEPSPPQTPVDRGVGWELGGSGAVGLLKCYLCHTNNPQYLLFDP